MPFAITHGPSGVLVRLAAAGAAIALAVAGLTACSTDAAVQDNPNDTTEPSDAFPITIDNAFGQAVIESEPQRIVVVGLTEQDVLLELGVVPIATTEWYGEQPYAVWPWATELLRGAEPVVLDQTEGPQFEKIASLEPDLTVGTNAGLDQETYDKLSEIAPTVSTVDGEERYFSDWRARTRQIAKAVGRSAEGEQLIAGVDEAYAAAAAAHPEFAGKTASFSQGSPWEGALYVYPDGVNTDFLTDLGFTMTQGLESYADMPGEQADLSAENVGLIDADVIVFATEKEEDIQSLMDFGTLSQLDAVTNGRAVYTDGTLAGAVYFMTPLSQKYVLEHLVPRLVDAVDGKAPQTTEV
ncbi:ABC transporter substrate-binding protein [Pseudoclavibacter chungangensis]|uniref:ABC transporter substrate-binding protein n=1 Tax=Pseudoclavibacter chungangensis TaxID=587635 RepID=A0A7J5BP26_9MICO|nr:ABC transporter substrate-binding protein [Pseudoclavibacter chungangensis]KAB1654284.1 ABC transporter substrate-binding protein [Pseudoclavibacter chungangensis]NYJ65310.1 iron complex transport system substrate-binding protein [Pseudoclavibacter chungangensis]